MRWNRLGIAGVAVLGAGGLAGTALGGVGETVRFSPQTVTVAEDAGHAVVTIERTACQLGRFNLAAHAPHHDDEGTATPDVDYVETHSFETWNACTGTGRATTTLTVPILDDADEEGDEQINLELDTERTHTNDTTPVPSVPDPTGAIVIQDDDSPRIEAGDITVNEKDGVARIPFRLVNGPGEPTWVNVLTRTRSAQGGEDFEHIDEDTDVAADGTGTAEIPVEDDGKTEGDEQFEVDLSWGEETGTTVTVTLQDPPAPVKDEQKTPTQTQTTATTATTATSASPPPAPVATPRAKQSKRKCVSKRRFVLELKGLKTAKVRVGDQRMKVTRKRNGKLTAVIDLRGNPKGQYTVKIAGRNAKGKSVAKIRRYRTCSPRKAE